jgi:hypothetical protein
VPATLLHQQKDQYGNQSMMTSAGPALVSRQCHGEVELALHRVAVGGDGAPRHRVGA